MILTYIKARLSGLFLILFKSIPAYGSHCLDIFTLYNKNKDIQCSIELVAAIKIFRPAVISSIPMGFRPLKAFPVLLYQIKRS